MVFVWTQMLCLLLILPALAGMYVLLWRRRQRVAARLPRMMLARNAGGWRDTLRTHLPPALLLFALASMMVAVARPATVLRLPFQRSTVILAIDVSDSMKNTDVAPSRLTAAQEAAKQFIAKQPQNVQIGLVAFSTSAMLVQTPTVDRQALRQALDRLQLGWTTAIGDGVLTSLATLFPHDHFVLPGDTSPTEFSLVPSRRHVAGGPPPDQPTAPSDEQPHNPVPAGSDSNAAIILLTDGANTDGPDPIAAAHMAADYGVRVYTVGAGPDQPAASSSPTSGDRPDVPTLKQIADITKGQFFAARSAGDLQNVYQKLNTQLVSETKLTEVAFMFAGLGALLALISAGLSMAWVGRIA
jgi:Ca-activated chloride channel family protein